MKQHLQTTFTLIGCLLLFTGSMVAMAPKKTPVHIPAAMQKYFHQTPDWDNDGKATGWLEVPKQGQVFIKLVGKNYYDPNNKPKDYKIMYIGHDTHGLKHILPKGLYYWQDPKDKKLGHVRPAADNKFANKDFSTQSGTWLLLFGGDPFKTSTHWDTSKIAHPHPSKEIAELIYNLEHS